METANDVKDVGVAIRILVILVFSVIISMLHLTLDAVGVRMVSLEMEPLVMISTNVIWLILAILELDVKICLRDTGNFQNLKKKN